MGVLKALLPGSQKRDAQCCCPPEGDSCTHSPHPSPSPPDADGAVVPALCLGGSDVKQRLQRAHRQPGVLLGTHHCVRLAAKETRAAGQRVAHWVARSARLSCSCSTAYLAAEGGKFAAVEWRLR